MKATQAKKQLNEVEKQIVENNNEIIRNWTKYSNEVVQLAIITNRGIYNANKD